MDDVRGDVLGPPHGTTPAAVIANKIKVTSCKSSEIINETGDEPYRVFGYFRGLFFNTCLITFSMN